MLVRRIARQHTQQKKGAARVYQFRQSEL